MYKNYLMQLKINNLLFISVLFIPAALVTGPFLPDFLISITSLIFIIYLWSKNNLFFLINDFFIILLIFYSLITINSFFSNDIFLSIQNTFFYFRFLIFAFLLKYLIVTNPNFLKYFTISILTVLIIVSLDAIFENFIGNHWYFDKSNYAEFNNSKRISGLFDEEYILGGFVLSLFPFSLVILKYYYNKKVLTNVFFIFLTFIFIYTILLSGERSTLGKLLILIISCYSINYLINYKIKIGIIFFTLLLIFLIIISQSSLKKRFIHHSYSLIFADDINQFDKEKLNFKNLNIKYFSQEHQDHAYISLKMFEDKKLFGHGVKMFRILCADDRYYLNNRACSTHSHGIIFTFLSETGLVGFIFLLIFYFILIKNFLNAKNNIEKIFIISIFLYLFPFLPSGYFFNNYFSIVLYTLVGTYLGVRKLKL